MSSSCSGAFSLTSLPVRWKHGAVPVIGLTGAIGGGKSQVAALLGKRGAVVIDADRVGHEVLEHPEVRRQVIERFGALVVAHGPDATASLGAIDRRALGSIVFASRPALDDLEAIVHPPMRQQFEAIIDHESVRGCARRSCWTRPSCSRPAGTISATWWFSSMPRNRSGSIAWPAIAAGLRRFCKPARPPSGLASASSAGPIS